MPSVGLSSKVLVTGANGFIGAHIVKVLLDNGYSVRGTVRDDAKGEYLTKLFNNDKFEYVLVPDIGEPGAFDEAVRGVSAAIHTAANLKLEAGDPNNVIKPVVAGTVGILDSAKLYGSEIKRVIFTSSTIAVYHSPGGKYIYTEKDWNDGAVQAVEKQGAASPPHLIYGASKVLSERAAWDWIRANKDAVEFDITTICPPMVYGPMLHKSETQKDINASNLYFLTNLKAPKTDEQLNKKEGSWVDVRDIAKIHVDLLSNEAAGQERFLGSAGVLPWQDVYDVLNEDPAIPNIPTGTPGATKGKEYDERFDTSKLQAVLGVSAEDTYRPLSETLRDLVQQVIREGVW